MSRKNRHSRNWGGHRNGTQPSGLERADYRGDSYKHVDQRVHNLTADVITMTPNWDPATEDAALAGDILPDFCRHRSHKDHYNNCRTDKELAELGWRRGQYVSTPEKKARALLALHVGHLGHLDEERENRVA